MNRYYEDILSRIAEPPTWFDERAVPRFGEFSPRACADIYAKEVALVLIECQNCGHEFKVCVSWAYLDDPSPLSERAAAGQVWYGDPPNIQCCPGGPTMTSVSRRILEFWQSESWDWKRVPSLELELPDD